MANGTLRKPGDGPDEEPNNPFKGTPFEQIFSAVRGRRARPVARDARPVAR